MTRTRIGMILVGALLGFENSFPLYGQDFADCAPVFVESVEDRNAFYARAPLMKTMNFLREVYEAGAVVRAKVSDFQKILQGAVLLLHEVGSSSETILTMRHNADISLLHRLQEKVEKMSEVKVSAVPNSNKEFTSESELKLGLWFNEHFVAAFVFTRAEKEIRKGRLHSIEVIQDWPEIKKAVASFEEKTRSFFGTKKGPLEQLVSAHQQATRSGSMDLISVYSVIKEGRRHDFVIALDPMSLKQVEDGFIPIERAKTILIHMEFLPK